MSKRLAEITSKIPTREELIQVRQEADGKTPAQTKEDDSQMAAKQEAAKREADSLDFDALFAEAEFEGKVQTKQTRQRVEVHPTVLKWVKEASAAGKRLVVPLRGGEKQYNELAEQFYSAGDLLDPPMSLTPIPSVVKKDDKGNVVKDKDGKVLYERAASVKDATHVRVTVGQRRGQKKGQKDSNGRAGQPTSDSGE